MAIEWQASYAGAVSLAADRRRVLLVDFVKTPG